MTTKPQEPVCVNGDIGICGRVAAQLNYLLGGTVAGGGREYTAIIVPYMRVYDVDTLATQKLKKTTIIPVHNCASCSEENSTTTTMCGFCRKT